MLKPKGDIQKMSAEFASSELASTIEVNKTTYYTRQLYSAEQVTESVGKLGQSLAESYAEREEVHVLTVMSGATHFASDLRRSMQRATPDLHMTSDFVAVASYTGDQTSGTVRLRARPKIPLKGKHVLLAEDVYDTGLTLSWVSGYIMSQKPASLEIAVALEKDRADRKPDLLGGIALHAALRSGDVFVVGYGLDIDQEYRDLGGMYELSPVVPQST